MAYMMDIVFTVVKEIIALEWKSSARESGGREM
jgi:hypothetical protein